MVLNYFAEVQNMGFLRALWAVLLGTVVAAIIGALFDYLRPTILPAKEYQYLYPWVTAVAGLFGSIMAIWVFSTGGVREPATSKPIAPRRKPKAVKQGKPEVKNAADQQGIKTSEEVPGMPTFDLDELKAGEQKPADPAKEK